MFNGSITIEDCDALAADQGYTLVADQRLGGFYIVFDGGDQLFFEFIRSLHEWLTTDEI